MKQDTKEAEKLKELLKKADGHPMMKAILAEEAAAILAKRTEAAGKIEALRKEQADNLPKLEEGVKDKEAAYLKAKAALDAASDEFQSARMALFNENTRFDGEVRQEEAVLIESADPAIDEGIEFFRAKLDDLRKPGRISSRGMNVERNIYADTKTLTTETNADAVQGTIIYCQTAIRALEALKLSAGFHIEGIQKLKDALPSIEVYREVSGTKPLPGSKGINPLHLLPSDSEMDWKLGKLTEKFKKVMRK